MFVKSIAAGFAASALLASVAFAQTATTTSDRANMAPPPAASSSHQGDWRASKVVGLNVYNEKNENVGSINDLLMDKSGNIKAAVICVGGFLGMGSHLRRDRLRQDEILDEPVAYTGAGAANGPARGRRRPRPRVRRPPRPRPEAQSLVSRPRGVQCDQGRAEGDARVQVRKWWPSIGLRKERARSNRARFRFCVPPASPAACRSFRRLCVVLGSATAGAPASCRPPNRRTT